MSILGIGDPDFVIEIVEGSAEQRVEVHLEDIVKLQILNLAVKLYLTNPKQTKLLCQYVFSLARYDQNYDIRDRARFLRQFIFPSNEPTKLSKHAKKIFLATKPAPVLESRFKDREQFQLGSLSHYINARANGYHDLPTFPEVAPDSSVRDVEPPPVVEEPRAKKQHTVKKRSFYSESEHSSPGDDDSDDSSEEGSSEEEDSSEEDSSEEGSESGDTSNNEEPVFKSDITKAKASTKVAPEKKILKKPEESSDDSGSENESSSSTTSSPPQSDNDKEAESDSSESPAESSEDEKKKKKKKALPVRKTLSKSASSKESTPAPKPKSNLDLLLELDDVPPTITPVMTPSLGGFLTPLTTPVLPITSASIQPASASFIPMKTTELLNRASGGGLSVMSRFTRSPHLFSPSMVTIELQFTNMGNAEITDIKVGQKTLPPGMAMHEFATIGTLAVNASLPGTIGVDFNDSTQPISFDIVVGSGRSSKVTLKAPMGELIRAVTMPESLFYSEQGKLKGMTEHSAIVSLPVGYNDQKIIYQRVYEATNVAAIPSSDLKILRFAGQTLSSKSLVLIIIKLLEGDQVNVSVNCEKMVIGSMLLNEIKSNLRK